ncbi:MAG TPA: VanZ family protein [Tissierellia bacterium]|nr:VanZ family protein [Tissierellia bacterium]
MSGKKILSISAFIIWIAVIFLLSAQPKEESNALSMKVAEAVSQTVLPNRVVEEKGFDLDRLNNTVRTHAHFLSYLVLGILTLNLLGVMGISKYRVLISLLICVVYAITDEFHQIFVPGRGAQISDILVDSFGALVGIGIMFLGRKAIGVK